MSVRPYRDICRRKSREIRVGSVVVGGGAPISVQSMTNTLTSDVEATVRQIRELESAGADIVRVSCPDRESTAALSRIVRDVEVPVVADIHFHYKRAIEAAEAGAACLRINPGNIGARERVREVVKAARDLWLFHADRRQCRLAGARSCSRRYGEPCPEAMVESALNHAKILEDEDFFEFKISCKASDVFLAVAAYQWLGRGLRLPAAYRHHRSGRACAAARSSRRSGWATLLWSGIGDTLRVSLSADPVEEIQGRLRHAEGARAAASRRQRDLLPVLCPPAVPGDQDRRSFWNSDWRTSPRP